MAIYYYDKGIGSRSEGKNAVFAVAYIRGEKRQCLRTNETFDFSNKHHVLYTEVILPDDAPAWATKLYKRDKSGTGRIFSEDAWNKIELIEKRVDSQLYDHHVIAIPIELDKDSAIQLVKNFVKDNIAIDGYFAEVAIHWELINPHAHIIRPMRKMDELGFAKKRNKDEPNLDYLKKKDNLLALRKAWADQANIALKQIGSDARIDHRSYQSRGIDLVPMEKIGPVRHMNDSDVQIKKVARNEAIKAENLKRITESPDILAKKLLQESANFTESDVRASLSKYAVSKAVYEQLLKEDNQHYAHVAREVIKELEAKQSHYTEKDIKAVILAKSTDQIDFDKVLCAINQNQEIINLGLGKDGRIHYTSKASFEQENRLIANAEMLYVGKLSAARIDAGLVTSTAIKDGLNVGQTRALYHLTLGQDAAFVIGYAGTGKSYMLKSAKSVWEQSGHRVFGVSTTGKAAKNLQNDTGIESQTIYQFLKGIEQKRITLTSCDVIAMDEAGMTCVDDFDKVVKYVKDAGAKFVGVGDLEQTQAVGRGAPFRAMLEVTGFAVMDEIIRQKVDWMRDATILMSEQKTDAGLDLYNTNGAVSIAETANDAKANLSEAWYQQVQATGLNKMRDFILIAHTNEAVAALNYAARAKLLANQALEGGGITFKTDGGRIQVSGGERLVLNKTDYRRGFYNGDFGTVTAIDGSLIKLILDDGKEIEIDAEQYRHFDYGYAATVHKLQGFTGDHSFVYVDGRGWDRHLMLVAATRHRHGLSIVADKETYANYDELKQAVSRTGLKDTILSFPATYSMRRGIEPQVVANRAVQFIRNNLDRAYDGYLYLRNIQDYHTRHLLKHVDVNNELAGAAIENAKRQDAIKVANFADNRIGIAQKLQVLTAAANNEKDTLQKEILDLRIANADIAQAINANFAVYEEALARNKISKSVIDDAVKFGEQMDIVKNVADRYKLGQLWNPTLVNEIYTAKLYTAVYAQFETKDTAHKFINEVRNQAMQRRYELALEEHGTTLRTEIKDTKRYADLSHEIGLALEKLKDANEPDKSRIKDLVHDMSVERNRLAHEILMHQDKYTPLIEPFEIKIERLTEHAKRNTDRELVRKFVSLPVTEFGRENLMKQCLAHKIKTEPKRFGMYVEDFAADGWKTVNIENWHYERYRQATSASAEFKESLSHVRQYFKTSHAAKDAWAIAIKRKNKSPASPNYTKALKTAQNLSFRRDQLAANLVKNMERNAGAMAFDNLKLETVVRRAQAYQYLLDYIREERPLFKSKRAAHILANIKDYGSNMAVLGVKYKNVNADGQHYRYLTQVKQAPSEAIKNIIRLNNVYDDKRISAAKAWAIVRNQKNTASVNEMAERELKHKSRQRNRAAYALAKAMIKSGFEDLSVFGLKIDTNAVKKAGLQHLAHQKVLKYLHANDKERPALAQQLLRDISTYHYLYDYKISFDELRGKSHKQSATGNNIVKDVEIKRWNYDAISDALMNNAEETYIAILGEPRKRTSRELRYEGGMIVSLRGSNAGQWYNFSAGHGGGPIQAIQEYLGMVYKDAVEHGARLAGLSELEATVTERIQISKENRDAAATLERAHKIESAHSIWSGTVPAVNSPAERYFLVHRKVPSIDGMEIRYWPPGTKWVDYDDKGHRIEKTNKLPAAVFMAKNENGEITAVQRIYLDPQTGNKNQKMDNPKLSKGVIGKTGAVVVRQGSGRVYIAEGPETAVSIASADPRATVFATLSVSNLSNPIETLKKQGITEVVLAKDNDGLDAYTDKAVTKALVEYERAGIHVTVKEPEMLDGKDKTDWNDILQARGIDSMREALGLVVIPERKPGALEFSENDIKIMLDYLNEHSGFEQRPTFENALAVAKAADALMSSKAIVANEAILAAESSKEDYLSAAIAIRDNAIQPEQILQLLAEARQPKIDAETLRDYKDYINAKRSEPKAILEAADNPANKPALQALEKQIDEIYGRLEQKADIFDHYAKHSSNREARYYPGYTAELITKERLNLDDMPYAARLLNSEKSSRKQTQQDKSLGHGRKR